MAITVKDIRNKQFTPQRNGYNKDEVDDFLDELADQLEELIKENLSLAKQLKDRPTVVSEPVIVERPVEIVRQEPVQQQIADPAYDEPTYFKNLETTLRDTLINAQRIADETVADARKKAKQMVTTAEEQSNVMLASAKVDTEAAKKEADEIRRAAGDYRARFLQLVEDQVHLLKADGLLFE